MQNNEIDISNIKVGQIWKSNCNPEWLYIVRVFANGFSFFLKRIPDIKDSKYPEYGTNCFWGDDERLLKFEQNHTLIGKSQFNIDDLFNTEFTCPESQVDRYKNAWKFLGMSLANIFVFEMECPEKLGKYIKHQYQEAEKILKKEITQALDDKKE